MRQTEGNPDNNLPVNQEDVASESGDQFSAESIERDKSSDLTNEHQSKAQGANLESPSDLESIEKAEDAKTEARESPSTNEVNKAPLKDTSNIRKGPKNKDKKSFQKEDREELHVAIEKSGKRRKNPLPTRLCQQVQRNMALRSQPHQWLKMLRFLII